MFAIIFSMIIFSVIFILIIKSYSEFDYKNAKLSSYDKRLKWYYKNHSPRLYLINQNCEARLVQGDGFSLSYFYIKERGNEQAGRYFEVSTDDNHVCVMWAILDMEFNESSTYTSLMNLYDSLNLYFTGKYTSNKSPRKIHGKNQIAQNEFCRMEWKTSPNGEKFIICSEIWGTPEYDKPKKFSIEAKGDILLELFMDFAEREYKLQNYSELFEQYSNRSDCKVLKLEGCEEIEQNRIQDFQQSDSLVKSEQTKKNIMEIYKERNLDL